MYKNNEFGEQQLVSHEAAHMQAALAASERLMPNMADAQEIQLLSDRNPGGDTQIRFANQEQVAARAHVIATAARVLRSRYLDMEGIEGRVVAAAITHQFAAGGPAAADSLGPAVSAKLEDGMKLEIKRDRALEEKARKIARDNGAEEPMYVRRVELRDRDGKLLGSAAVAISVEKKSKGTLI